MAEDWPAIFGASWDWVKKIGAAITDPEEKKAFWETIKAKKRADPNYNFYDDFPRSESANRRAMEDCMSFIKSLRYSGGDKDVSD